MGNLVPISSLKRDEIYSFLGGLFIACSWSIYFQKLGIPLSNIDSLTFALMWLLSTALLFIFQLIMTFSVTKIILSCLQNKKPEELQNLFGFKDPICDFVFLDYHENLLISSHIMSIIFFSFLISVCPLKLLYQNYFGIDVSCFEILLFIVICVLLFYFYFVLYRQYLAIVQLRAFGRLDFIDKKKYCEELAIFSAECSLKSRK